MKTRVVVKKRYQGREVTATIKANTKAELDSMLRGIRAYAKRSGMGAVKVLRKHKDPDGGYEAIVQAHNWNPIKWAQERWEARGGGAEKRAKTAEEKRKIQERMAIVKRKRLASEARTKRAEAGYIRAKQAVRRAKGKAGSTPGGFYRSFDLPRVRTSPSRARPVARQSEKDDWNFWD